MVEDSPDAMKSDEPSEAKLNGLESFSLELDLSQYLNTLVTNLYF